MISVKNAQGFLKESFFVDVTNAITFAKYGQLWPTQQTSVKVIMARLVCTFFSSFVQDTDGHIFCLNFTECYVTT